MGIEAMRAVGTSRPARALAGAVFEAGEFLSFVSGTSPIGPLGFLAIRASAQARAAFAFAGADFQISIELGG
jgi:hypothetical protein